MGSRGGVCSTVVVVTWRGVGQVAGCLDALAGQERPHRVLVVDNASDDGTARLLAEHPSAPEVLRLPRNAGYAGGIAAALSVVDTPFVAWLNDDAVPAPGWLAALEATLRADPALAAVGSRLEHPGGGTQSLGIRLTHDGHGADRTTPPPDGHDPFGFCGGAALLRTAALRAVGGVPAHYFCYYEDTDTAWRLRLAGWRVAVAADAVVVHRHGASSVPGSARFHRWNERNRLWTLLRCAPARVAVREWARFAARTAVLPARRARTRGRVGAAPNLRAGLRCRVLFGAAARLPRTVRERRAITRLRTVDRAAVWNTFHGQ